MTMKMCRLFHCGVPHETLGTLPDLPLPVFPHATPGSRRKSLRFVMFMDRLLWIGFSSHDLSTQCFAEISLSHGDLSIWEPLRPLNVCDLLVPASKCQKNWEKLYHNCNEQDIWYRIMGYAARHTGHTCLSWKFEDLWGPWGPREDPGRVNFKTWCWGDYSCLCRIRRWELSGAVVADLNRSHGSRFADSAGETMGSWIPTRPTGWVHNCLAFKVQTTSKFVETWCIKAKRHNTWGFFESQH